MKPLKDMTDDELAAHCEAANRAQCEKQGLPYPPNDPVRAAKVARILNAGRTEVGAA